MSESQQEKSTKSSLCMIWMHGLGADATDMQGLAGALPVQDLSVHHVFLNAPIRPVTLNGGMPMTAWYDITGLDFAAREDRAGILDSERAIVHAVEEAKNQGFQPKQIILCGFSQGGAMALFTGLRLAMEIGGIVSLSAYLPLAEECQPITHPCLPIFMGYGKYDDIVFPQWTQMAMAFLEQQGVTSITSYEYPMAHAVCNAEMNHLAQWLRSRAEGL